MLILSSCEFISLRGQWPQIVAKKWPQKATPPVSRIVGIKFYKQQKSSRTQRFASVSRSDRHCINECALALIA